MKSVKEFFSKKYKALSKRLKKEIKMKHNSVNESCWDLSIAGFVFILVPVAIYAGQSNVSSLTLGIGLVINALIHIALNLYFARTNNKIKI